RRAAAKRRVALGGLVTVARRVALDSWSDGWRPIYIRPAGRRTACSDRRDYGLWQERAVAHVRRRFGGQRPAESPVVPARRLQGRRGVRTVRRAAARRRHRSRFGRAPRRAGPDLAICRVEAT